jgi:phage shock protein A
MANDGSGGTIYTDLRLKIDKMENDALVAQKRLEHYAKEFARQGEQGGKLYVKGFNKGAADLNKRLNDFVGAMSGISPRMGALGDKIAKVFSKPIFAMIPAVTSAFQAMLPVIGTIIVAIAGITAGISKALNTNESFRKGMDDLKSAMGANFAAAVRPVTDFFAGIIDKAVKSIDQANKLKEALDRLRKGTENNGDTLSETYRTVLQDYEAVEKQITNLQNRINNTPNNPNSWNVLSGLKQELKELMPRYDELKEKLEEMQKTTGDAGANALQKFEDIQKELADAENQIRLLPKITTTHNFGIML